MRRMLSRRFRSDRAVPSCSISISSLVVGAFVLATCGTLGTLGTGCGRANPRIDTVTRTQGDRVVVSTLAYDQEGHIANVRRIEGNEEEAPDDFTDYTWLDGKLTTLDRTITFDDFVQQTVTTIEYDRDLLVGAATTTVFVRPDEEPFPVSEETITMEYDDALFEGFTRSFEDRDRNKATTVLSLVYDVAGLIEVREDTSLVNNGAPDVDTARVTTVEYTKGKPTKLTVVENEGRATTHDIVYKSGVLEVINVAIPILDEFNNEQVAQGETNYRFDSDDRLIAVDIESDIAETVTLEIEYVDGDDEANGIDLMPAGAVQLPLWDLRGQAYDGVDARTQVPRFVGASW
jgi:hypothetical protein